MKKIFLISLLIIGTLVVMNILFSTFNAYIYQQKQGDQQPVNIENTPTVSNVPNTSSEPPHTSPKPPVPQAKIDVRVACESALMYMTFTDGDASAQFVQECIEGQHPEVIERYIFDMGADGRVI